MFHWKSILLRPMILYFTPQILNISICVFRRIGMIPTVFQDVLGRYAYDIKFKVILETVDQF